LQNPVVVGVAVPASIKFSKLCGSCLLFSALDLFANFYAFYCSYEANVNKPAVGLHISPSLIMGDLIVLHDVVRILTVVAVVLGVFEAHPDEIGIACSPYQPRQRDALLSARPA
jgi:hypothetical protein